jgi:carbon-monoxide dehydrogenase medium subunit
MQERVPRILAKIVGLMANPQVRNIATLAGNVAFGSPAADSAPPLLALDAFLKVEGKDGKRSVALDEFFLGPGETALKMGELITEIVIPEASLHKAGGSEKFMKRKANTLAVSSAAVAFDKGNGDGVKNVRIAVGAVAPTPLRIKQAEALLEGQVVDGDLLEKVKAAVGEEITPITDVRSTAWFRKETTPVLVERCIQEALA